MHVHSQQRRQYLERFLANLFHCQAAIFCEELQMGEKHIWSANKSHFGATVPWEDNTMPTCRCCKSSSCMFWERLYTWEEGRQIWDINTDILRGKKSIVFTRQEVLWSVTCTELVMVLRANTVAQSFMVDWLSNAPWVSTSSTATCRDERGHI